MPKIFRPGLTPSDWVVLWPAAKYLSTGIEFAPPAAISAGETHAALLLSKVSVRDFSVRLEATTIKQLRQNSPPNPWECFWFIFNWIDDPATGKKQANYLAVKPNGLELGTMSGEVDQKFIATPAGTGIPIGTKALLEITKSADSVSVSLNGKNVIQSDKAGSPYSIYDQAGVFGLYSEDALCKVSSFTK